MLEAHMGHLRLYQPGQSSHGQAPASPEGALPYELFEAEIMRPAPNNYDAGAPLTLPWFLEAERLRYHRQGHWIESLLEFSRHSGERLLGVGGGLGTDWVQYALHGAEVMVVCPDSKQLEMVRANFALRNLSARCEHASPEALPLPPSSIDVACLSGPLGGLPRVIDEAYRVLKPGGKLLAVLPAAAGLESWWRWLPGSRPFAHAATGLLSKDAHRYSAADLTALFSRFVEPTTWRRHLRRNEVPTLLRFLPVSWLECVAGRLFVFRGFKPVSAALALQQAA